MQQKMLSDQPLRQVRQAKRKRNKNDGKPPPAPPKGECWPGCRAGAGFLCRSLLAASVRWLAAIPLLSHFCSCSFTLLPQALPLTDWKEMA